MKTKYFADTNLFLRILTNDIPLKANAVANLFHQAANGKFTLATTSMVLAEIVWTLESFYKLERSEIQTKILAILNTPGLDIENGDLVFQAIIWYVERNVDFIDAYNAAWMNRQDITTAFTFDKKHFSRFQRIDIQIPQ